MEHSSNKQKERQAKHERLFSTFGGTRCELCYIVQQTKVAGARRNNLSAKLLSAVTPEAIQLEQRNYGFEMCK